MYSWRADQSWNVTLTSWVEQEGGKYSWHTNRKWRHYFQWSHHTMGFPVHPLPPCNSSFHTWSLVSLIFQSYFSSGDPLQYTHTQTHTPPTCILSYYFLVHILISSLQTHPILTFKLSQIRTRSYKSVMCSFEEGEQIVLLASVSVTSHFQH